MKLIFKIVLTGVMFLWAFNVCANTRLIKNLDVWDVWSYNYNASHWMEQGNIHAGVSMYGDVDIYIKQLPDMLKGADWIQTAYGSKTFKGSLLATFQLQGDAEVYIIHSKNGRSKPVWLKSYILTNQTLVNSGNQVFDIYKKNYHKGDSVRLGANGQTDVPMYMVVVKSIGKPPVIAIPQGKVFDVVKYGAVGDDKTINTRPIQTAIDACAAAGGGSVYLHGGVFVTGTIELKNNVTLFVQAGSILRGSANGTDYPQKVSPFKTFRSNEHYQLIYAEDKSNITITGGGIIDGFSHGEGWPWKGKNNENERPRLIRMVQCSNVTLQNISLLRSANWTQYYEACNHLVVNDVRVRCFTGQNNEDGIDISSCNGVQIRNFYSITGDDGICIKSMSPQITQNVNIDGYVARYANCHAVKIGTETHSGVKNLLAKNVVANARYGIAIESVDGADVENITYENILLTNCSTPLFIRLGDRGRTYDGGPKKAPIGSIKNIIIRNVTNTGITFVDARNGPGVGSAIGGIPEKPIENLLIENCNFLYYGTVKDTAFVYQKVPENSNKYPEFNIYGTCPAYGLYFRHVKGLTIKNTKTRCLNLDVRPAIVFDEVQDYNISHLNCEQFTITTPSVIWDKQKGNLSTVLATDKTNQ